MVAKILGQAALIVGTPSFILGYIFSHATWKNDVLFLFGVAFWCVWLVGYAIMKFYQIKTTKMRYKQEKKNNEYEEKIRNLYGPDDNHRLFN